MKFFLWKKSGLVWHRLCLSEFFYLVFWRLRSPFFYKYDDLCCGCIGRFDFFAFCVGVGLDLQED